jgi:hypothetical protein
MKWKVYKLGPWFWWRSPTLYLPLVAHTHNSSRYSSRFLKRVEISYFHPGWISINFKISTRTATETSTWQVQNILCLSLKDLGCLKSIWSWSMSARDACILDKLKNIDSFDECIKCRIYDGKVINNTQSWSLSTLRSWFQTYQPDIILFSLGSFFQRTGSKVRIFHQ